MLVQGLKSRIFSKLEKFASKCLKGAPCGTLGASHPSQQVHGANSLLPDVWRRGYPIDGHQVWIDKSRDLLWGKVRGNAENGDQPTRGSPRRGTLPLSEVSAVLETLPESRVGRALLQGDLVLKKVQLTKDKHKLSPPWEGPYVIAEFCRPGSYRLMREDDDMESYTYNIDQLRCYFA